VAGRALRLDRGLQQGERPGFRPLHQVHQRRENARVCSTTLPQKVLPKSFRLPLQRISPEQRDAYSARADAAHEVIRKIPGVSMVKPSGAFYVTVTFDDTVMRSNQSLPVANDAVRALVEERTSAFKPYQFDKRFAYYLIASYGLCVCRSRGSIRP